MNYSRKQLKRKNTRSNFLVFVISLDYIPRFLREKKKLSKKEWFLPTFLLLTTRENCCNYIISRYPIPTMIFSSLLVVGAFSQINAHINNGHSRHDHPSILGGMIAIHPLYLEELNNSSQLEYGWKTTQPSLCPNWVTLNLFFQGHN